jgi:hypothetical protein
MHCAHSVGCGMTDRTLPAAQSATPATTADDAVIRVYDEARNGLETHENAGEFKEW